MRTMRTLAFATLATLLVLAASCARRTGPAAAGPSPLAEARQVLLVLAPGWDAPAGALARFEREALTSAWKPVGAALPTALGRNGLGWGLGLHPAQTTGPFKREGDGKAPAGAFRLGYAFGYAPTFPAARLPYFQLTPGLECVDDARSRHYNRILSRLPGRVADWDSSETMLRSDDLYSLGLVVEHNANPPEAGAGSCIFLHVWNGPGSGTAGCTALDKPAVAELLGWLDAAKNPVLVQLPRAEYDRLKAAWGLP